jgi:hypothetical protein
MTPVGFEPAIPSREQPQNHRAATVTDLPSIALPYYLRLSVLKTVRTGTSAAECYRITGSLGSKCSWFRQYRQRLECRISFSVFRIVFTVSGWTEVKIQRYYLPVNIQNVILKLRGKMSHFTVVLPLFYDCILQDRLLISFRLNPYFEHWTVYVLVDLCNVHARYSLWGKNWIFICII